jgi:ERCC4-type nuclease
MITSVLIDSREPPTYQLKDYGAAAVVTSLDVGDLWAATDDGHILVIERKTTDDLLASIKDDRLFTQVGALAEKRIQDPTYFPYLVIEGRLAYDLQGMTITNRGVTGWNYNAVMGALVTVQEMGVPVVYCMDADYANCIKRLGDRKREDVNVLPARAPKHLGDGAAVLLSLPGIGPEMLNRIWQETNGVVAHALWMLSDPEVECSVPKGTRKRIRKLLGLSERLDMAIDFNSQGQEVLKTYELEVENG